MSTTRDFDRAASAWLAEGPTVLSDRVLDAALREVHVTHQRRRWPAPWRNPLMTTYMRLAAGVAIVAILGVGALIFVGSEPQPPVPSAVPTASPAAPLHEGLLVPGRYRYDGNNVKVTVTVPEGWEGGDFGVSTGTEAPDGANLGFRQPTLVFGDPCDPEGTPQLLGPTVEDLVTALSDLPNVTAAPPADVTISGFSGTRLTFVVDTEGADCVMGLYRQDSFIRSADNGQNQNLWILDVAGTRLVIDSATYPDTPAGLRAELQAMVDTLLIEPSD